MHNIIYSIRNHQKSSKIKLFEKNTLEVLLVDE